MLKACCFYKIIPYFIDTEAIYYEMYHQVLQRKKKDCQLNQHNGFLFVSRIRIILISELSIAFCQFLHFSPCTVFSTCRLAIIIPFLHTDEAQKLRPRKIKSLIQGFAAVMQQSWDPSSGSLTSESGISFNHQTTLTLRVSPVSQNHPREPVHHSVFWKEAYSAGVLLLMQ